MNYRKRKKYWTTMLRKLNAKLEASGNPLNAVLNGQLKYCHDNLRILKNEKRTKT